MTTTTALYFLVFAPAVAAVLTVLTTRRPS